MGYYSEFKEDGTDIPFVADVLDSISVYTWQDDDYGVYLSSAKWYDWLTDLQKVAKLYPDNYLVIMRHGEEGGDISRAVVANGKVVEQRPKLVWPETGI
jgi:hypothetical protein